MKQLAATVKPVAPFDFGLTAGNQTFFRREIPPTPPLQRGDGGISLAQDVHRRLLDLRGKLALASVRSVGSVAAPELAVELQGDGLTSQDAALAADQVAWILGAHQHLAPFYTLAQGDPVLSAIVERFYGLHLPHAGSVFEALVLAILGQQIASNVARIIRTLLIETYGPCQTIQGETYYAFPRPESLLAASVEELQRLKLSRRKAEYIQGIAAAALGESNGLEVLRQLPDAAVVEQLMQLRGVGPWTAQCALIRALGRPDAFPLGDLALRRTVSRLYFNGEDITDADLEKLARRWSPWRTFATVYLFTALRAGMA
mgnify:CR=1 FL=1